MRRTAKYVLVLSGVILVGIAAFMRLPALKLKAQQTSAVPDAAQPYNIIFVISDQEADHLLATGDYELPARDELKQHGVVFRNLYIASAMCTPSRAAFLSGQPPQVNGVFDQMELGYVPNLRPDSPNMGSVLKGLGYATAYFLPTYILT
jgi:arylsulfatase